MHSFNQPAVVGAFVLALSLVGYAIYQLVLYPSGGFPASDFAVIVRGANMLRVGHWLKFGYAISLTLLTVGVYARISDGAPVLAQLASITRITAIASMWPAAICLHILDVAEQTFATNRAEAEKRSSCAR